MILRAPCKLNLTLDVFDKNQRTDGYHNLDSLVLPLSEPADELHIRVEPASEHGSIRLTCNDLSLPLDSGNLAYRAADRYLSFVGKECHVSIDLIKSIPMQAGLGGGSSDAAAVLRALNDYFHQLVERPALIAMASRLGADVALFLAEGPVRISGYGEVIEPIDLDLPTICGVLVHPGTGVSTPQAYGLLDAIPCRQAGTSTRELLAVLQQRAAAADMDVTDLLSIHMSNDFESAILPTHPDVARAYAMMVNAGAMRSLLCGSGSAVFGLARSREHAVQLFETLNEHFPFVTIVTSASKDSFQIQRA